jgi:hypothetical protein
MGCVTKEFYGMCYQTKLLQYAVVAKWKFQLLDFRCFFGSILGTVMGM